MCGILGWMTTSKTKISGKDYNKGIETLFKLSETRGKEASGVCSVTDGKINILKAPVRAKKLIASNQYKNCVADTFYSNKRLVMGHARMVTNGSAYNPVNNQPIVRRNLMCIHNGIIVNAEKLWEEHSRLERKAEVDTEIFLALMEKYGYVDDFFNAFQKTVSQIEGSLTIALIDRCSDWIFLYTNIGSLYLAVAENKSDLIFSSERYILEQMIARHRSDNGFSKHQLRKVEPRIGCLVNLSNGKIEKLRFDHKIELYFSVKKDFDRQIALHTLSLRENKNIQLLFSDSEKKKVESLISIDRDRIHALKRCSKCLLPETFPGIKFDERGICSVCKNYKKIIYKGKSKFLSDLSENYRANNRYNCIIPISGGRDSCYILHYLVKELHLKPVAYTYDWGLITDLARRNIQRMCSALGVEHILISADINLKRRNVKKNVEAWLKNPILGTVPLFMAGDKQFFYYAQLLKRQMHIDNVIFGMNKLEETQFKAGFARIGSDRKENDSYYNYSIKNKIMLFADYGKEFIKNPLYLNTSLIDSFAGYLSYYVLPQHYLRFFDYVAWDQKTIEDVLMNDYKWEGAADTIETWRVGDGTAPLYNYIYYRMAGFTEFDTFKSNQIREGILTRESALKSLDESNRISVEGLLWYCKTIDIDPVKILKIINRQKTLY